LAVPFGSGGSLSASTEGRSGRSNWPSLTAGPNKAGRGSTSRSSARVSALAAFARQFLSSTTWRPISSNGVFDAGGAGRFAGAAGQAAVEMQARLFSHRLAFEHLLDQVDAAARAVQFVAQQLVGRAGGGAKAAMHALAQDLLRLLAGAGVADKVSESGIHQNSA
jgi:hypothetical protein